MSNSYLEFSEELAHIGQRLVDDYHPHLRGVEIAYLLKVNPKADPEQEAKPKRGRRSKPKAGKIKIAWAQLVNSKYRLLFAKDFRFIITADKEIWDGLSLEQQVAVMDHELCHCVVDDEGNCMLRKHDLEEFRSTVARHGAYLADIQAFAEALQRGSEATDEFGK